MGKLGGFKEFERADEKNVTVKERVKHYKEFTIPLSERDLRNQGSRCMDCGIAFCHSGCPLGNLIPEFNDRVYNNQWKEALDILHSTNNFPEFTGRLCPAPCEKSCVLGIVSNPVSIENIEKQIVERGFAEGWVTPKSPKRRTGKKVAVIGSGPAGMAAAQQLNRAGHMVIVYERNNQVGGLLRYGIPNFKLEKEIIDRRVEILRLEGITFRTNSEVGKNVSVEGLAKYDAIVLCAGATKARGLNCPGADNKNVVQAMTYLTNQYQSSHSQTRMMTSPVPTIMTIPMPMMMTVAMMTSPTPMIMTIPMPSPMPLMMTVAMMTSPMPLTITALPMPVKMMTFPMPMLLAIPMPVRKHCSLSHSTR